MSTTLGHFALCYLQTEAWRDHSLKPFSLRPTVSSKNDEARRYRILRQKRFGDLYSTAKKEFREGNRGEIFTRKSDNPALNRKPWARRLYFMKSEAWEEPSGR